MGTAFGEGAAGLAQGLVNGFMQGRRMEMEKKRLNLEQKMQENLNDYRMRMFEIQQKEMQQQQSQFGEQLGFEREKMMESSRLKEKEIQSEENLQKAYMDLRNVWEGGKQDIAGNRAATGEMSAADVPWNDASQAIEQVMTDDMLEDSEKLTAIRTHLDFLERRIASLGLDAEDEERQLNQVDFYREQVEKQFQQAAPPPDEGNVFSRTWRGIFGGGPQSTTTSTVPPGAENESGDIEVYLENASPEELEELIAELGKVLEAKKGGQAQK